jgi:hypothetical protein
MYRQILWGYGRRSEMALAAEPSLPALDGHG